MAAAREVAVDIFFADDLLDQIDRFERRGVHLAYGLPAVALDQRGHRQLHPGENHAAVAGAGAPSKCFRFEYGDFHAALRERTGRGEATVACADNGNVHAVRQFLRRSRRRGGNSLKPVVLFLDRHDERLEVRGILALLRSVKNAAGDASILKTGARVRARTHQAVLAPSPLLRHRPREATAPAARIAAEQFMGWP